MIPTRLKPVLPGATIGLVSPATSVPKEKLETGIAVLEGMGFRTKRMPHVADKTHDLAGNDEDRAADIQAAFADPEIDAVLCTRGGYGCARLLRHLDLDAIAESRKPFMGFSDITTLHIALNRRGLPTFHAPMVSTLAAERPSWVHSSFASALAGDFRAPSEARTGHKVVPGIAEGIVAGGCLTLMADSMGTKDPFCGKGKIVLIEDIGEPPHRVDAMLTHLLNAGALDGVAGFAVGEMTDTDLLAKGDDLDWRTIVRERIAPLGVPTTFNFPFGHIDAMLTLPLGLPARLDANAGTLTYL